MKDNKNLLYFYPITSRTHHIKVDAAHHLELSTPIVSDYLHGTKAHRLPLHAESITLQHPISNEVMTFEVQIDFLQSEI